MFDDVDDFISWDEEGELIDLVHGHIYAKELSIRIKHSPNKHGIWTGDRGTSVFVIIDEALLKKLERYGCNGIEYDIYAEPDFSQYAVEKVGILNMGHSRRRNFEVQLNYSCLRKQPRNRIF